MKTRSVVLLIPLALLGGCVNTHEVTRDETNWWVVEANHDLRREEVVLVTASGEEYAGTLERMSGEAVFLRQSGAPYAASFALDSVVSVGTPRNPLPALGGFLLGAVAGGLVGATIGGVAAESSPLWGDELSYVGVGAAVGGFAGGVAGAVGLSILSAGDRYVIAHPPARRGKPSEADSSIVTR